MNFLKTYESISIPYKGGDYALVKILSRGKRYNDVLVKFLNLNNISTNGISVNILNYLDIFDSETVYLIQHYQIICWSENKEELEILIDTKKYNL